MEKQQVLELLYALRELVELKEIKEKDGETEDYIKRKPLAWSKAKRLVHKYRWFGVTASTSQK